MEQIKNSSVFATATSIEYAEGSIVSKIVLKKQNGNITLFAFDKGQELSEHSAPHETLIQVIDGAGVVIINKEEYHLKKDEAIILPANIPHGVRADQRFKMILTMIK